MQKEGPFRRIYCRTKSSGANELSVSPSDVAFLDNLTPATKAWLIRIDLCGQAVTFKIDTGAEVTAISKQTHEQLGNPLLHTPDRMLFGPASQPLKAIGSLKGKFTIYDGQTSEQTTYVIEELERNLLGLPAIMALQLASRIHTLATTDDLRQHFLNVFKGLGNLGDEFDRHTPLPT